MGRRFPDRGPFSVIVELHRLIVYSTGTHCTATAIYVITTTEEVETILTTYSDSARELPASNYNAAPKCWQRLDLDESWSCKEYNI